TIADAEGNTGAKMEGAIVFDHTLAGEKPVFTAEDLEAKRWESVSFQVPVADAGAALSEGVTEADRDLLVSAKASVYAAGTAVKGDVTKKFAWSFPVSTEYGQCKGDLDGKETPGALVTNGGVDRIQL